ncbi:MAG: hypothetical protein GY862_21895 [Gammaproteobacteria bacterium]|nr:hypothetical protein [Gammaproteobacteria bacterium]
MSCDEFAANRQAAPGMDKGKSVRPGVFHPGKSVLTVRHGASGSFGDEAADKLDFLNAKVPTAAAAAHEL